MDTRNGRAGLTTLMFNVRGILWAWILRLSMSILLCFPELCIATQNRPLSEGSQPQSSAALRSAQSALENGDSERAIRILSDYLQTHTGDYAALANLGEIYNQLDQPQKAEPLLERAVKASRGLPEIRTEWAVSLVRLHEYNKAQSALSGVLPPTDRKEQIRFHRLKASIALGLKDAKTASLEMEKALALQPTDAALMIATAAAQLQAEHWQRAAELAKPVFDKTQDPAVGMMVLEAQLGGHEDCQSTLNLLRSSAAHGSDEMVLRQRLAALLVSHGKYADSIDDFQRVVALDPSRSDLYFNLALAQFKAGRLDEALPTAEKAKTLEDSADLEDLLGDIQEGRGNSFAAVKNYQAAVALAPNEEKYRLSLGLELLRHNSFDAARVVLKQTDAEHPNSWRVQFALGMLEYFEGKEDAASPILLRAADLSPEPAVVFKYVGDIEMDRPAGPDSTALAKLCFYADLHPKEARMQYYCGALLFQRDFTDRNKANFPDILRRLNFAAKQLPNDASAHCQFGKFHQWLDQWQEALREFEACARLDPDSAQAHYRLAQAYKHEGQAQRAEEEVKLFEAASKRVADENARRDETMKSFLYTIQQGAADQ
jgi:tetratricopeptide (TPR) repeat protein